MIDLNSLLKQGPLLLDGGMGTMLMPLLEPGQCPEILNRDHSDAVALVHQRYLEAGSRVVYTNTFGANRRKLGHADSLTVEEAVTGAVAAARTAAKDEAYVALDLGPVGELVEPMGILTFEETYDLFRQQVVAGAAAGADLAVIESMADLYEVKAAILAVRENSDLPLFCTMSFESNMRTYTGCHVDCMALVLETLDVDALGINCSLGPVQLLPIARQLLTHTNKPVIVKPNAGLPVTDDTGTHYDIDCGEFAAAMADFITAGAQIVGGCCGTNPDYLAATARAIAGLQAPARPAVDQHDLICTASRLVQVTADTAFGRMTLSGDSGNDLDIAMDFMCDGAEALLVTLTAADPTATLKEIQASVNLPLVFVSEDKTALEAALRICNGRPGVNTATAAAHPTCCARYGAATLAV